MVETIKWQTWAAYGCLFAGQSMWAHALPTAYRLYARSGCSCGMRLVALSKCYAFAFANDWNWSHMWNKTWNKKGKTTWTVSQLLRRIYI